MERESRTEMTAQDATVHEAKEATKTHRHKDITKEVTSGYSQHTSRSCIVSGWKVL